MEWETKLKYISVCSGIEAATVAWHPLGWSPVAFSEIEPFPAAVLAHHYPDTPNLGDMTKWKDWPDATVDVLVGGTPCQSFSVAGLRAGMADPRGNLALVFLAIADRFRPRWVVWENVPGVLSSNGGRDFGSILGALGELGYGWAYRVLDAQHFGVPQRRRRVFLVGYLGDWRRAAAVLFERESLRRNPAPRREAGQGVAPSVTSGAPFNRTGNERIESCALIQSVAETLLSSDHKGPGFNRDKNFLPVMASGQSNAEILNNLSPSLHCNGDRAPMVPVAIQERAGADGTSGPGGKGWRDDGVAYTLESRTAPQAVAFDPQSGGGLRGLDLRDTAQLQRCQIPAIAFKPGQSVAAGAFFATKEYSPTLQAQNNGSTAVPALLTPTSAVRRLTPEECCRLQQFPDDYLEIKYANANEAHASQVLHLLWREIGAKGIAAQEADLKGYGHSDLCEKRRIAAALFTPEVLLSGVFVGWIQWHQARQCAELQNVSDVGTQRWTHGFVRRLREVEQAGRSPYRRESFEQLARELSQPLSELPLEKTQAGAHLRSSALWQEAQRAWPLRYALATPAQVASGTPLNSDGPRYRALGNSMAVPCMRWLGERIAAVDAIMEE